MIIITETQTRLAITVGSLFFGFLLAIMGLISGNQPLISPDLRQARETVWKNKITSEELAEWILSGRRDFFMVGFREGESCLITSNKNRFFECFDLKNLKNTFWLRRHYPNLMIPMVVYSGTGEKSLDVSAWLQFYGYRVKLLEGGYRDFINKYISPVEIPSGVSAETLRQLKKRQLLYWYFSGKDPNISAQSYGNTSRLRQGNIIQDDVPQKAAEEEEGC